MIEVVTRNSDGKLVPVEFATNAVEIIDGALVIYTEGARDFWAGFNRDQWVTFQRLDVTP